MKLRLESDNDIDNVTAAVTGSLAVQIEDDSDVFVSVNPPDINVYSQGRLVAVGAEVL